MIDLIVSMDYELFGNGSGDVRRDMIEPAERLLAICDRHGAKVSLLLEVGEYWAMRRAEQDGSLRLEYSPSQEIERQIRNAVRRGHDVQLHLHPWWVGASLQDGNWRLYPQYRQITDLPNGLGSAEDPFSVVGVLSEGKRTLEAMVRPIFPDYECLVYRAAMFWGQPSDDLVAGLKRAGLIADSSVVSGLHDAAPVPTDYRRAVSNAGYWWTAANDISQSGPRGRYIIELPVYSRLRPYLCNFFNWTKLSATFKRRHVERGNMHGHGMMQARKSRDPTAQILRKLGSLQPLKHDFCKLSARDLIGGLRRLMVSDQAKGDGVETPMVMLGHSKDFWNDRNLEILLRFVEDECQGRVRFSTLAEVVKRIAERDRQPQEQPVAGLSGNGG